jgi:hypothetical protein
MANPKNAEFDNFVKRQQQLAAEAAAEIPFDPKKEIDDWLGRLNTLYSQINEFLKDYIHAGSITTEIGNIELNEEFSGPYEAPTMMIHVGLQEIKLIPIGTMLIGSKGRVDVIGRSGTSRLILVNKNAASANQLVSVTIADPKNLPQARRAVPQQIEWVWKIATRPPTITFIELNKESFLEMLLEVSNA